LVCDPLKPKWPFLILFPNFPERNMHIKEIILDGFKSYPNRTVVSGFDPAFNAITGLNGSGKSNILDSICFVLGITQLSQVRVGNLQELVYKQGQAGVTKATVSIVFDNSDPKTSPVGYEQHSEITVARQVVINGKNKFMINGHTAQQEQVSNPNMNCISPTTNISTKFEHHRWRTCFTPFSWMWTIPTSSSCKEESPR